ncbi:MAG: Bug family tripartite tricarboxylate transporter substrate binding protein [Angustibacter sp.]
MTQHVLTLKGSRAQRPRSARRVATAAVASIAALALAACGGNGSTSSGSDTKAVARLDIMAPAAPGGGWDGTARAMGASIESADLAKSVTVKNVTGAGGTVGLAQLANDKSDHSLMVMGLVMVGAVATNQAKVTLSDVTPIARLTAEDEVIVVPAASPYKTIKDLADAMKAKGRAVTITGGSAGGTDHMVAGLLAKAAGVEPANLNYIPFSGGGESLAALLGNKVQAGISGVSEYAEQIKAGKLRALAVAGPSRVQDVDAPTLKESGFDVELTNWRGVVAPKGISADTKKRLVTLVTEMHDSPGWKDALTKNGWQDTFLAGDEFQSFMTKEISTTEGVLKDLGLVK